MLDIFPLQIFPEGALASSVITTVWVGVFIVAYFNLRLGWVLSGLVIPGYMVPLLLSKPYAAITVFAEGIITYFLVWLYSEYLSKHGGWSNLFGRDRFFALILTSVAVRITLDGWLLPWAGEWLVSHYHLVLDYRNNFHSFGLIIVSLIANNFWKTGFKRGIVPMFTIIGLTYLIVRYGLMEFTNFSASNISYMYEDMTASILASPKAYIILIITAFVASRMNLLYGWDFAGILIPSLLALQWYEPWTIVASFAEAIVILFLGILVLKLPVFQRTTIEGARKLLLFFNISFVYKFVLAYVLLLGWPQVEISDYYGFGYLLPTLIALKMHDKDIFARMTRASLQTSLVSVAIASAIGFVLTLLPHSFNLQQQAIQEKTLPAIEHRTEPLMALLQQEKLALYRTRLDQDMATPLPDENAAFANGIRLLLTYATTKDNVQLDEGRKWLDSVNYQVALVEDHLLLIKEKAPYRHWGVYVVNIAPTSKLAVEIPAPLEEKGTFESGAWIFKLSEGNTLAIAGAARKANIDGSSDVLMNPTTIYNTFHHEVALANVLQVRGYTTESARLMSGVRRAQEDITFKEPPTQMMVRHALPEGIQLEKIKQWMDTFSLAWKDSPIPNIQRETMRSGFAELFLNTQDIRKLLARSLLAGQDMPLAEESRSIEGYLQDWLLANNKVRIAPSGSNLYRTPTLEELLFFDDEVVTPMLRVAKEHYHQHQWSAAGLESLKIIRSAAKSLGYELTRYHHQGTGTDYLILAEPDQKGRKYQGTYVLRLGEANETIVQSPRPIYETYSFEFAVSLFESNQARALLVGGAYPDANQDFSSDILRLANKESLFSLMNQSLIRESSTQASWIIQCRTMGSRPDAPMIDTDVLVAVHNGVNDKRSLDAPGRQLASLLDRYGMTWRFTQGRIEDAGYDATGSPQSLSVNSTMNKTFATLWLSPSVRGNFRQQTEVTPQEIQFRALGIPSLTVDLHQYLSTHTLALSTSGLPNNFHQLLAPYFVSQDIVTLESVHRQFPKQRWVRIVDVNSRLGFLLIQDQSSNVLAVINLTARNPEVTIKHLASTPERKTLDRFIESGAAWLERTE